MGGTAEEQEYPSEWLALSSIAAEHKRDEMKSVN